MKKNVDEDVEKLGPSYVVDKNVKLRERVEREVGGGIGMGNTCKPMAVSF